MWTPVKSPFWCGAPSQNQTVRTQVLGDRSQAASGLACQPRDALFGDVTPIILGALFLLESELVMRRIMPWSPNHHPWFSVPDHSLPT